MLVFDILQEVIGAQLLPGEQKVPLVHHACCGKQYATQHFEGRRRPDWHGSVTHRGIAAAKQEAGYGNRDSRQHIQIPRREGCALAVMTAAIDIFQRRDIEEYLFPYLGDLS